MTIEIVTPVGRMVQGHPMVMNLQKDNQGQPKKTAAGEDYYQCYVGLAIPKGGEQHWNQTEWGGQIWQAGQQAFPRGEANAPTFAWKVTDGDSQVPNKKGTPPCAREGFPGHWIVGATNGFAPDCFADGNYGVKIMRQERFKTGDYMRLCISVKGNESTQSPGVYINLHGCELIQAGPEIKSEAAFDGAGTFGAVQAQPMPNMLQDPNVGAPQQPPAQGYGAPAAQPQQPPVQQAPAQQGYVQQAQQPPAQHAAVPPQQAGYPPQQGAAGGAPAQQAPASYPNQAHNFLPQQ